MSVGASDVHVAPTNGISQYDRQVGAGVKQVADEAAPPVVGGGGGDQDLAPASLQDLGHTASQQVVVDSQGMSFGPGGPHTLHIRVMRREAVYICRAVDVAGE
jgi:hypothetical protein